MLTDHAPESGSGNGARVVEPDVARGTACDYWRQRRIVITGGHGFIGRGLRRVLAESGVPAANVYSPSSRDVNLLDGDCASRAIAGADVVFHLAGSTGGIAFSRKYPASQYTTCTKIDLNVFEACVTHGTRKLVLLANLLAYPAAAPSPLREDQLLLGPLAATHMGIGCAKRNLVSMSQMYFVEKNLHSVVAIAANAYGPNDRFDPAHSHVIPALIYKCRTQRRLEVWGSGREVRDFLYVDDLARGLLLAGQHLAPSEFVNLGSGEGTSVADLVKMIAELTSFPGPITFDTPKAAGDLVRIADTEKCRRMLQFAPQVDMRTGLANTISWYDRTAAAAPHEAGDDATR